MNRTLTRMAAVAALSAAIVTGSAGAASARPVNDEPTTCQHVLPTRCLGGDAGGFAAMGVIVGRFAVAYTR